MPKLVRKRIAKKSDGEENKPSSDEEKKKKKKKVLPKKIKECFECVDAGAFDLVASYLDIPPEPISGDEAANGKTKKTKRRQTKKKGGPKLETETQEIGCIPWRLSLVHQLRKDKNGGFSNHILKLTLYSDYRKDIAWRADVSGTLTMKKWLEKLPEGTNLSKLKEHSESFSTAFTQSCQLHSFSTEFPLPIGGIPFSAANRSKNSAENAKLAEAADVYLKNRQFKFELRFLLHNVEFSHIPKLDFHKNNQSFCNAMINIGDHKFYVNKEYLSMYSPVFDTMFSAEGFVESQQQKATLQDVSPTAFNEFLHLIYDPMRQPQGTYSFFNNLLKIARCYMIQCITNRCEQQLLLMGKDDDQTITVEQRMKLAEEYDLVWLKAKLIVKNEADDLLLKVDGFISDETRQMLLRKKNAKAKEEEEEEEEAKRRIEEEEKKKMEVDGAQGTSAAATRGTRGRSGGRRGAPRGGRGRGRGRGAIAFAFEDIDMDVGDFGFGLL